MTDEITELTPRLNALPDEARAEKRATLTARRAFAAIFSPFVKAMTECMTAYREARAQGVERADAAKGIEQVLRDVWGRPTTKYPAQCGDCEDTGYREYLCRQWARCERHTCQRKGEEFQHTYVRPCECVVGQRFVAKVLAAEAQLASVGKVKKAARGFQRMGS